MHVHEDFIQLFGFPLYNCNSRRCKSFWDYKNVFVQGEGVDRTGEELIPNSKGQTLSRVVEDQEDECGVSRSQLQKWT